MTAMRAKGGSRQIWSWPFGPLGLVGIAIAVLAAPRRVEGPVLIPISPGHALAALDAAPLGPLLVGPVWLYVGLWHRRVRLAEALRASPGRSAGGVFLAGLGLGLLLASAFSTFFWWWAVGAVLVGAASIAGVVVATRG